jgi:hypothetical protein
MLVISKDVVTLEYFEDNELQRVVIDHENNNLTKYMDHAVAIVDGVTVRDLFNHIAKEKDLINTVFDCSLGGYELDLYLAELDIPTKDDNILKYAVFEHKAELVDDHLITDVRFSAVGSHPEDPEIDVSYTLELSPINMYADLPVVIDDTYIVWTTVNDGEGEEEVSMLDCQKSMTLYDIIGALLYEISYHGTPEMRKSILDEVKKHILSEDNDSSLLTMGVEDMIKDLETQLEISIQEEDYETSANIRDKIKELKNKKMK